MIVDAHAYVGDSNIPGCSILLKGCAPEQVLYYADQAGIDKTVIMPNRYLNYREANEIIARAVKQYPNRFIGFGKVDPAQDKDWLETLAIAIEKLGLKGIGEMDIPLPVDKDFAIHELLERCGEYKVPVMFHCQGEGAVREITLARIHPKTNIILGHMGFGIDWRTHRLCIQAAKELPNLYIETSTVTTQITLKEAGNEVPNKVLFGSDSPAGNPKAHFEMIKAMEFSREVEKKILGENAKRLLKI